MFFVQLILQVFSSLIPSATSTSSCALFDSIALIGIGSIENLLGEYLVLSPLSTFFTSGEKWS